MARYDPQARGAGPASIRRRLWLEWIIVATIALGVVLGLSYGGLTERIDNIVYDRALDAYAPSLSDDILIVTIDDASLQQLGRWPWPRTLHARLIDRLSQGGAKAIGYDILFPEASTPAEDKALATSLRGAVPTYLPQAYDIPGPDGTPYLVIPPIEPIGSAASAIGHVSLVYDNDGVVRRIPLRFGTDKTASLHLTELLYRSVSGHPSRMWDRSAAPGHQALIPFQSHVGEFATISFVNVLNGEVPPALIRDKIILVGAAASGMGDIHPTPTGQGGTAYGVELLANALNAMINNQSIRIAAPLTVAIVSLIPLAIMVSSFWLLRPRTILLLAFFLVGVIIATTVLMLGLGLWLIPTPALVGVLLVYPLWGWRRLQAMDDFVGQQLDRFTREDNILPDRNAPALWSDHVGERTHQLDHAISEVRNLRRFVSDILEQLPDPMLVIDAQDTVRLANVAAGKLFGESLFHQPARTLLRAVAVPEDRRHFDILHPEIDESHRVTFRSITGRSYEVRSSTVRADNGEQRGLLYYLADVSGQKRAAEEREELLQLLTHDMRSPQSSILALLEGVPARSLQPSDYERLRSYARKTLTLADNFVHLARLKGTDFEPEYVDFGDIVQEAADDLYVLANRRGIHIQIQRDAEAEYWVMGEAATLHRAFVNLFDNAVKYSPDGSDIRVQFMQDDTYVRCRLSDQGPGIDAALAERLFTRFGAGTISYANSNTQIMGAGLGLNFVQSVIERHDGRIWIEDNDDPGATFVIELPIADEEEFPLQDHGLAS